MPRLTLGSFGHLSVVSCQSRVDGRLWCVAGCRGGTGGGVGEWREKLYGEGRISKHHNGRWLWGICLKKPTPNRPQIDPKVTPVQPHELEKRRRGRMTKSEVRITNQTRMKKLEFRRGGGDVRRRGIGDQGCGEGAGVRVRGY